MDRYPPKSILLAALGMFGVMLFTMIAIGALMGVFIGLSKAGHLSGSAVLIVAACVAVAGVALWLAYLSLRSVVRRIKEANQAALAGRAVWEASFRAEMERRPASSSGK